MFFQNLKRLEDIIDTGNLIHKFLPKQTDIDKMLHIIQRKVLKGTHLPVEIKEIQALITEQTSKLQASIKEVRSIIREIHFARLSVV